MKAIMNIRIVRWYSKLLFVIAAWALGVALTAGLEAVGTPVAVRSCLSQVLLVASVLVGARVFRGSRELPVEPPRPWWRMTSRPRLSRVLGILLALLAGTYPIIGIGAAVGHATSIRFVERETVVGMIADSASAAILAFLYLNSAARLSNDLNPPPQQQLRGGRIPA